MNGRRGEYDRPVFWVWPGDSVWFWESGVTQGL